MARTSYELTTCPICGRGDAAELADREAICREVERRWEFHMRRLCSGVPARNLVDRVAFSQDAPLRLVRCRDCGHVYRNPRERRETLDAAYNSDVPDESVLRTLFDTQRGAYAAQARRLVEVAGAHGRGLEVGSYVGGFLAAARDHGWEFEGVDVSEGATAFAARGGFTVTCGEITSVVVSAPYDAIAIWNTFEQLYDSRVAVDAARKLLRDDGMLVVRIPNGSFYERWRARLDGPLGGVAERLLAHNNLLGFPYRQGFTERSLGRLLGGCGFMIVRVFGDTLVPIADQWTTTLGAVEERVVKRLERALQHGWNAPWVEVYARCA
jgi:SAM-dependent methyltransferase